MKVLALYNIKGGVGKTATAVNLAWLAANAGYRTLLWDLDPQGAASFYFRIRPRVRGGSRRLLSGKRRLDEAIKGSDFPGLDVLPADFSYRHMDLALDGFNRRRRRLKKLLKSLRGDYDLVILDCAPSISLVSENVFQAADALLVPTIPTTLSLRTLAQLQDYLRNDVSKTLPVWPFFTMVDRRKRLHRTLVTAGGRIVDGVLGSVVPNSSDVEKMGEQRNPLPCYAAASVAGRAYAGLWQEVRQRLNLVPRQFDPVKQKAGQ